MKTEPKRLYRSRKNRVIAGVCGGLAAYFNVDPTVVRVVFVVLTLLWGSGIILYLALWIIVPLEGKEEAQPYLGRRVRDTADELKQTAKKFKEDISRK